MISAFNAYWCCYIYQYPLFMPFFIFTWFGLMAGYVVASKDAKFWEISAREWRQMYFKVKVNKKRGRVPRSASAHGAAAGPRRGAQP